jgi:hypothetical protein
MNCLSELGKLQSRLLPKDESMNILKIKLEELQATVFACRQSN